MLSKQKKKGATAVSTTAPKNTLQQKVYQAQQPVSSTIDDLLAMLLFCLQNPIYTPEERAAALDAIDGLIRLKADLGLIRRMRRAS